MANTGRKCLVSIGYFFQNHCPKSLEISKNFPEIEFPKFKTPKFLIINVLDIFGYYKAAYGTATFTVDICTSILII